MRRKHWPRKSGLGLGLGLGVGGGGRDEALYVGTGWTYSYATGIWTSNPTVGENVVTNGNFTAWTLDNPDNWTLINAEDANNYVTQNPAGQAKIVSDGAAFALFNNLILTIDKWYLLSIDIKAQAAGAVYTRLGTNAATYKEWSTVADNQIIAGICTGNVGVYLSRAGVTDITVDNVTAKQITLATTYALRNFGQQVNMSALASIPVGLQGGVVARWSDANNFLVAFYNRCDNKVYLYKYVAGTPTALTSTSVAYAQWSAVEIRFSAENTAQLYYGGTQRGADQDVSTVTAGNYAGIFSTHSAVQLKTITHTP